MREIKFRGKRTDSLNEEWIYGSYMDSYFSSRFGLVTAIFFNNYDICKTYRIPVEKETVGQYTGLKDKNGIEIFEGDILSNDDELWLVEYLEEDAMFILNWRDIIENFSNVNVKWFEVIGNIYDNPELLEKE